MHLRTGIGAGLAALLAGGLLALSPVGSAGAAQTRTSTTVMAGSCGGAAFKKADGTSWKCSFEDNFNGSGLNPAKWRVLTSATSSFGSRPDCFLNSPQNIYVGYGVLTLTARRLPSSFTCTNGSSKTRTQTRYSAGMVSTYTKWSQQYGRYEFRAKFPNSTQKGLQAALWLWPQGDNGAFWPASGEMDIAEWYSQYPDRVIPYLHNLTLFSGGATNNDCIVKNVQNWHTYLLIWTARDITIKYDGTTCLTHAGGAPFNKPYILSLMQGFGVQGNTPTDATPGLNKAQFDWVRVWR